MPQLDNQPPDHVMRLHSALDRLVKKLDEVAGDPNYRAIFALAAVRGVTYHGPQYGEELAAAKDALAAFRVS
jgi:hypothetical protein